MWEKNGGKTPCKNCNERHEGCHSGCDKYHAFKQEHKEKYDALKQWKSETFTQRMDDPKVKLRKEKKRTK